MRTIIVGVAAALLGLGSTALAQECFPAGGCDVSTTRLVRTNRGDGFGANTLNITTTLVSSAFSLALSNQGKNGKQAGRPWGWTAVGVGLFTSTSAFITLGRQGPQPFLSLASAASGAFAMMAGSRILRPSWQAPDQARGRVSVAPTASPTDKSAGVSVSLRF